MTTSSSCFADDEAGSRRHNEFDVSSTGGTTTEGINTHALSGMVPRLKKKKRRRRRKDGEGWGRDGRKRQG